MIITPQQQRDCIIEMTVKIAKFEGFLIDRDVVCMALVAGSTKNPRVARWIATAWACFDAVEKALTDHLAEKHP